MRADAAWEPGDKSDDWHVVKITHARPIPRCYLFISSKKPQKKQKDEMRSEMRGGRAFRELVESWERKVTKVNRTVPARCRLE